MFQEITLIVIGAIIASVSGFISARYQSKLHLKRWKKEREIIAQETDLTAARDLHKQLTYKNLGPLRYGTVGARIHFRLQVESGPDSGTNFPVQRHVVVVGREADLCDYTLSDPDIAELHLRLIVADKVFVLEDISGGYGTKLNDLPMSGPRVLTDNDLIRIGETDIRFCIEA